MTRPTRSIHRLYGESGIGLKSKSYWTAGDAFWVFPAILYRYWTEPVRGTILIWGFFGLWPISNIRNEREAWSRIYYLQISSWEIWYCPSWAEQSCSRYGSGEESGKHFTWFHDPEMGSLFETGQKMCVKSKVIKTFDLTHFFCRSYHMKNSCKRTGAMLYLS